jgi:hypothetical protein
MNRSSPLANRQQTKLDTAREAGLLGQTKDARIAGRVSAKLLGIVRAKLGNASDSEIIEIALTTLALEDEFGAALLKRKESVPRDIALGFD